MTRATTQQTLRPAASTREQRGQGRLALRAIAAAVAAALLAGCANTKLSRRTDAKFEDATAATAAVVGTGGSGLAEQAGTSVMGGRAAVDSAAEKERLGSVVRRSSLPFIGSTMVPSTTEDKLPSIFFEPFVLDFADIATNGRVSLRRAMMRLSKLTGVPIRVEQDVFNVAGKPVQANVPTRLASFAQPGAAAGAGMPSPALVNAAAPVPMPSRAGIGGEGEQETQAALSDAVSTAEPIGVDNVDMHYAGSLAGYLDNLTNSLGLAWEYRDRTIVIQRYVTALYEIASFSGSSKYTMSSSGSGGSAGGGGGGGGSTNAATATVNVSESGGSDPVATITKAIQSMLDSVPGSSVTTTDGSGRIVVKTTREMQSQIRDYIKAENKAMLREASIQFDIYSITTNDNDEKGVSWSMILQELGAAAGAAVGGNLSSPGSLAGAQDGTASVHIVPNIPNSRLSQLLGNSSAFLQLLNEHGYSAQHRPVSLLALNRQWARISQNSTEYYLSETTPGPATSTGVGAPGLKTDHVTTGDQYVAMPQILDDNTILLKFGVSLSDLLGLFNISVGSGASQQLVQAPKVSAVNAQFPIAIRSGEIAVVTGLSRTVATSNDRRLADGVPLAAGGSKAVTSATQHFIIFIRPTVL